MNKWKLTAPLVMLSCGSLLQGCADMKKFTPESVIANALDAEADDISFYGELEMTSEGIDDLENVTIREWRKGKSHRVEMDLPDGMFTLITDGEMVYMDEEQEDIIYYSDDEIFHELMMDPKEELDMVLEMVEDTHDMKTAGEEKIAGRDTFLVKLTKQKGEKSLFGDQELWIDKENWMVLKMISASGNLNSEIAYTSIDYHADIDPSIFELDNSEEKELKDFEELTAGFIGKGININEIPKLLSHQPYYLPDNHDHQISSITYSELDGESAYKDVTIDYQHENIPLLRLSIVEAEEEKDELEGLNDSLTEEGTIRQLKAQIIEVKELRTISWKEDGLNYSIILIDPELSWEQVKKWAAKMKLLK